MNDLTICRTCGRSIPADAPQGICPACVFGLVGKNHWTTDGGGDSRSVETPSPGEVAEAFPQLEIIEPIGHGGMGAVYRVRQISLDRIAALKLLNVRLAGDPLFKERFAREAKLMARLLHPNIATIFEFGQSGDFCYLLMEFIEGVNLRHAIGTNSMSPEEALRIIPQICDALQYAHEQGVIHRDVKPENILLDKYGRVKLVDFGLAKLNVASLDQMSLTGTRQIMGTMNYMAPEQREQSRNVDHRADIYSLGVVFYELLTGELPLGKFPEPSRRAKSSQRLDPVVMRTLEKDPDSRYQSASEVRSAVDAVSHAEAASANVLNNWKDSGRDNPALPFRAGDNIQQWQTFGLAQIKPEGLAIEYHRLNKWWGTGEGIGTTLLPFDEIAAVRIKNGPISRGLEITTRSLGCLADFPGKMEAGLFLRTRSIDDETRRGIYESLCERIGQKTGSETGERQFELTRNRLHGPATLLGLSSILNLLYCFVSIAIIVTMLTVDFRDIDLLDHVNPRQKAEIILSLLVTGLLAGVFGVFQRFAWSCSRKYRDYWIVMLGFVSALLPFSLVWLIGLPAGIWGLVAMGNDRAYTLFTASGQSPGKKAV